MPSGKVPRRRWMYGAQCRPGRTAISKLRVEDRAEVLRVDSRRVGDDQRERADVRRRAPSGRRPSSRRPALDPVDDASGAGRPRGARFASGPRSATQAMPGGQAGDAEDVGRARLRGSRADARAGSRLRVAAGAPLAPGPEPGARADVEGAGAGRAVEGLVAGEGEQVDRRRLQVDRHDARPTARRRPGTGPRPRGRSARSPRSAGPCPGRSRRASGRPARVFGVRAPADVLGVEVALVARRAGSA